MLKRYLFILFFAIPFASLAQSTSTCKDSTYADPYYHCDEPYHPVCGCDNITYRNACAAQHWGGIFTNFTNWTDGVCGNFDFDFVPNPISVYSSSGGDAHLHVYINDKLLPASYQVYIFDVFNRIIYQGGDQVSSNSYSGVAETNLTTDFLVKFQKGVYILVVVVNGEKKTKKLLKINIE